MISAPCLYDLLYPAIRGTTYATEAGQLTRLLQKLNPQTGSILDVACGTGGHVSELASRFEVTGLDQDRHWLARAQQKLPGSQFLQGNMVDFQVGRRFDAIFCLGSSIGYVMTGKNLQRAAANFRAHLHHPGVLILEPWFTPEHWQVDRLDIHTFETTSLRITRKSFFDREDDISRMTFDYSIEGIGGSEHQVEQHELGLFSQQAILEALHGAGFAVEYRGNVLPGRDMYVARTLEPAGAAHEN